MADVDEPIDPTNETDESAESSYGWIFGDFFLEIVLGGVVCALAVGTVALFRRAPILIATVGAVVFLVIEVLVFELVRKEDGLKKAVKATISGIVLAAAIAFNLWVYCQCF